MAQSDNSERAESNDKDMLSNLPDCLLHHIMSFLTAYEAVRMCVLSKRWKNLWTTLPVLDFDLDNFLDYKIREWPDRGVEDGELEYLFSRMFRDFVNMTLLLRKPIDLLKFRLFCSGMRKSRYDVFVNSWIRYALEKNPQVLDICIYSGSLHVGIFSCESLVDLSLYCYYRDHIPVVNLPCLSRLHLHSIYINQDFMGKLLRGCPMLENLHLVYCDMEVSSTHSESLKYLTIEKFCAQDRHANVGMELINAPNLLCFFYGDSCGQYIGHKMLLNMPSLISATIFRQHCHIHMSDNGKIKVLAGISSVRKLKLGGFWMKELLENELPSLPKFQNVKALSLTDFCLCCNLELLASFLEHFPNLEILSFLHHSLHKVEVDGNQETLKIAPFKCKHLHEVNVNFFVRDDNDIQRVKKYLEDDTRNLRAQINVTDCANCFYYPWRADFF